MSAIVFRVEHLQRKVGPFMGAWERTSKQHAMRDYHEGPKGLRCPWDIPCPQYEGLYEIERNSNLVCGFHKLSLLLEWFPRKTRELMTDEGFVLYKFDADECYSARQQCVFNRHTAILLKTYRLVA